MAGSLGLNGGGATAAVPPVELEQFLANFRVARTCQRQLGFLVTSQDIRSLDISFNMIKIWTFVMLTYDTVLKINMIQIRLEIKFNFIATKYRKLSLLCIQLFEATVIENLGSNRNRGVRGRGHLSNSFVKPTVITCSTATSHFS